MLTRIDRYLLRHEIAAFFATIVLIVTLLSIENATRIHDLVGGTRSPGLLQLRLMTSLIPEYLGVALPLASFVAPAFAIRTLSTRGEWQMFKSFGFSPLRMMRAPLILACFAAGLQLSVRMDLEPFGERTLDEVTADVKKGDYGLPLKTGEFLALDDQTSAYIGTAIDKSAIGGVFVRRGNAVFTARSAEARGDFSGRYEIRLHDGQQLVRQDNGHTAVLKFSDYLLTITPKEAASASKPLADLLDRMGTVELTSRARAELTRDHPHLPAFAALLARISSALFCLMLPWFAFVLAVPPRRSPGGPSLVLGILAIVLFLRTTSLVQRTFTQAPIEGAVLHMGAWALVTIALYRFGTQHDDGAIDSALARMIGRLKQLWPKGDEAVAA